MKSLPVLSVPAQDNRSTAALVLLSGGLDSTAAFHWALQNHEEVRAIAFWYGQAHGREVDAARFIAERHKVAIDVLHLGEAVRGDRSLKAAEPGLTNSVSRANLPERNLIFLSVAAGHAMRCFPGRLVHLVIGCNQDDAVGFPDCRHEFLSVAQSALDHGVRGVGGIRVNAPWKMMSKSDVVRWCAQRQDVLDDIRSSVSCYAGKRCGSCDACTCRIKAFEEAGISDGEGCTVLVHGGDSYRERP